MSVSRPWPGAASRSDRIAVTAIVAAIVLLAATAHLPLRRSDYIQDDRLAVEANPIVARGNLREIFATTYWEGAEGADESLYRPVTIATFALERRITGRPDPRVSHAGNVALHVAASIALVLLLRRLGASGFVAGASGLTFAVHPVHVEAVAGIVGRAEILAAGLSLAALAVFTASGDRLDESPAEATGPARRRAAAWLTALLVFLALGAKEVAIVTPLLLVAMELLFRPASARGRTFLIDRAAALAPTALAVVIYAILRIGATGRLAGLQDVHPFDNPLVALDGVDRVATALALVPRFLGLLAVPLGLTADYSGPAIPVEHSLLSPLPLAGIALLAALAALALLGFVGRGRTPRLTAFAALLLGLPYLIVGNLLFDVGAVVAERLLYFPSAGFCVLLAVVLGGAARGAADAPALRSRLAWLAAATLIAGFALRTWARCEEWRDEETLFRAATRIRAASPRAQLILGRIESRRGDLPAALAALDEAVSAYPPFVAGWLERGAVLGQLGRIDEAAAAFRRAVENGPLHPVAHLNLGIAESRLGQGAAAERSLRKALVLDPLLDKAWASLGHLGLARGDSARAAEAYRRAIALGRNDLEPRLREALARAPEADR